MGLTISSPAINLQLNERTQKRGSWEATLNAHSNALNRYHRITVGCHAIFILLYICLKNFSNLPNCRIVLQSKLPIVQSNELLNICVLYQNYNPTEKYFPSFYYEQVFLVFLIFFGKSVCQLKAYGENRKLSRVISIGQYFPQNDPQFNILEKQRVGRAVHLLRNLRQSLFKETVIQFITLFQCLFCDAFAFFTINFIILQRGNPYGIFLSPFGYEASHFLSKLSENFPTMMNCYKEIGPGVGDIGAYYRCSLAYMVLFKSLLFSACAWSYLSFLAHFAYIIYFVMSTLFNCYYLRKWALSSASTIGNERLQPSIIILEEELLKSDTFTTREVTALAEIKKIMYGTGYYDLLKILIGKISLEDYLQQLPRDRDQHDYISINI